MKSGKHQRSNQRCQDSCWKVHDRHNLLVFAETLCMNYVINTFIWLVPQNGVNNYMYSVLCTVKDKKDSKSIQRRALTSFITIPLY